MSACAIRPQQILKRELSQREYEFLQEWAPESLKEYTLPTGSPPMNRMPQYQTMPSQPQGLSPRRPKVRSSVYEEWKSQTSHGKSVNDSPPMPASMENKADATVSPSKNARANSKQPGKPSSPVDAEPRHQEPPRPQQPIKAMVPNGHYAKPTASANSRSMTSPAAKVASKAGDQPHKNKGTVPYRRPPQDVLVYTAPNGYRFRRDELSKASLGIKHPNKLTVYFRPNFVEDPWKGLKPVLIKPNQHWW
ncbi:uncharacterized protein BO80DRAFT_444484 [Aspergillus ibericus CBS 121593]|uniref:Uncharacterized protein n=1 Tax=Aspergillus ibericus CBS 121593 TaxID=1448316 RepID=A0A395H1N6_9EURO|nr:hypothetical protein BO80DRAFT_444484 [Aspergillus ibericus CBS 121593]RAL01801.1 hypothetical protein BO80DRAFT_444484 [Aspergillus ibericus CBS 121593]